VFIKLATLKCSLTGVYTKNLILIRKADVKRSFANLLIIIIAMDHFAAITE